MKERWVERNVESIVRKSLRGETESQVRISRFPVEDVVSDESLNEDSSDLPSIASQTVLVNRLREILEREKRGNVTEEVDSDGTRMSVRTRDEGRIEEAELALDAANGLLMNLLSLKNLTEHVMDSGPEGAIKRISRSSNRSSADDKTGESDLTKSLVKLSPRIWRINYVLGEQAKDTMKAIGRERS